MKQEKIAPEVIDERRNDRERKSFYGKYAYTARKANGNNLAVTINRASELSDPERRVLIEITYVAGKNNYRCYINQETLRIRLGYNSDNTVRAALRGLCDKKIILMLPRWNKYKKKYNKTRYDYILLFHPIWDDYKKSTREIGAYLYNIPDMVNAPESIRKVDKDEWDAGENKVAEAV